MIEGGLIYNPSIPPRVYELDSGKRRGTKSVREHSCS